MKVSFHPEAQAEMQAGVLYYEARLPGLGIDFLDEVRDTLDLIKAEPDAWPLFDNDTRRCLMRRFPFGICFRLQKQDLRVVAVMHLRRRPGYWRNR